MCGRYTQTRRLKIIEERFRATPMFQEELLVPRYNVAPSQNAPVIVNDGGRQLRMMRWGLVPFWAKDEKIGYKMINAMAETVSEKPSYRAAFKKRRCLVVADGFYEWQKSGAGKIPHRFTMKDDEPFAFAGLWEVWPNPAKEDIESFTVITTDPNELTRNVHNRMPVILAPENYDAWLDPKFSDADKLKAMLKPFPADLMKATPVSTYVSNARNEGAQCIEPFNAE